ncbi:MAG: hypothetical protein J6C82_01390 [Clostridia bacterium]|nr:hypothetical protein [Clostridia bacterium]
MADMMSTLRGILGDNADDKIKTAMSMLSSTGLLQGGQPSSVATQPKKSERLAEEINDSITIDDTEKFEKNEISTQPQPGNSSPVLTPEGLELLGQIRGMVDRISNTNDSRSDLLKSLKPFMRSDRQRSIDKLIRVINIGRFSGLFGR